MSLHGILSYVAEKNTFEGHMCIFSRPTVCPGRYFALMLPAAVRSAIFALLLTLHSAADGRVYVATALGCVSLSLAEGNHSF